MERLADFTRKLLSVPKEEIAKREREYKAEAKRSLEGAAPARVREDWQDDVPELRQALPRRTATPQS